MRELLEARDGLIGGICNGFQALVKLGLVPYGEIRAAKDCAATLTFNDIGRHQSRLVRTRVASNCSPWLMYAEPGEVFTCPISHGEGKFIAPASAGRRRWRGAVRSPRSTAIPTACRRWIFAAIPTVSVDAIEGITSPDGRVFGKMGHSERVGWGKPLYVNVPGNYANPMFRGAVDYFAEVTRRRAAALFQGRGNIRVA